MKKSALIVLLAGMFATTAIPQCYELYFTNAAGAPHYGYLTLWSNGNLLLQVKYPNGYGGWNCVEQYVTTEETYMPAYRAYAGCVEGRSPRYCGTSVANSLYSPDNTCLINTQGVWSIVNVSGDGVSDAWIREVGCR